MSKTVIFTCSLILILGLWSGWDMLNQLLTGRIFLNIGIFFIPIGIGLFLGRPAARTAAVSVFFLTYALCAVGLIASLFSKATATFALTGDTLPAGSAFAFVFVVVSVICSVTGLCHWILYTQPFEEHLRPN